MLRNHLIHACTIQRSTRTRGANGEVLDSWSTHLTGVLCRLMADSQRQASANLGEIIASEKTLLLPAGTDVTNLDRIGLVTFEDESTDGPYQIISILPRRGRNERFLSLRVRKVE